MKLFRETRVASQKHNKKAVGPEATHDGLRHALSLWMFSLIGVLALSTGCTTAAPGHSESQTPTVGRLISSRLLESPEAFHLDFAYPPRKTMHSLSWERGDCNWIVQLPVASDAHAGVVFRRSHDLSHGDGTSLAFQMKPAYMAKYVTVSLLHEVETKGGYLRRQSSVDLDVPLGTFRVYTQGDWANFHIPLEAFTSGDTKWAQIRGIRVARADTQGPGDPVTLRRMALQRTGPGEPPRYASLR